MLCSCKYMYQKIICSHIFASLIIFICRQNIVASVSFWNNSFLKNHDQVHPSIEFLYGNRPTRRCVTKAYRRNYQYNRGTKSFYGERILRQERMRSPDKGLPTFRHFRAHILLFATFGRYKTYYAYFSSLYQKKIILYPCIK